MTDNVKNKIAGTGGQSHRRFWEFVFVAVLVLYPLRHIAWGLDLWDTGNHDALLDAADFVAAFQKRQGLYISCIEEIAFRRGFIDKEQLLKLAEPLMKTAYGQYLTDVANGL